MRRKTGSVLPLIASALIGLFVGPGLNALSAQQLVLPTAPVELFVPMPPTQFKRDGKINLVYEVHMTNLRPPDLVLISFEVLKDNTSDGPLAIYKDKEIISRLARPVPALKLLDGRMLEGGKRAVFYLWLMVDKSSDVPQTLRHRLVFKPLVGSGPEQSVEGAQVAVRKQPAAVIGPPVRGDRWAMRFLSNSDAHRRGLFPLFGKTFINQRFAIDISKIGEDGKYGREDDKPENSDVYGYGAQILAVADGVVARIKDGIPENDISTPSGALPNTFDTIYGNHIIIDIGNGNFAFYAHLQPNSFRVKVGDPVKRGQVVALLGNSGNATGPHLHFQMNDSAQPDAEGIPYVFDSFEVLGIETMEEFFKGEWKPGPNFKVKKYQMEMPPNMSVVRFS